MGVRMVGDEILMASIADDAEVYYGGMDIMVGHDIMVVGMADDAEVYSGGTYGDG